MSALRRVAINAVFLEPPMGGLETYVREIVAPLRRLAPSLALSVFANPQGHSALTAEPWASEVELIRCGTIGRRGLRALGELGPLGPLADRRRCDVIHSVGMTGPLASRAARVVQVADTIWLTHPDPDLSATQRLWRVVVPLVARRADRVVTITHAAAEEVRTHLGIPPERLDVAPLGAGVQARAEPTPAPEVRASLDLGDGPLVLCVAQKHAHKNLLRLVRAMVGVRGRVPDATLVLVGRPTEYEDRLRAEAAGLGLEDAVRYPGFVEPEILEGLYAAARVFVLPSLVEGFGLPILEAMARGVPVACSSAPAPAEVAGDAAELFDPLDEDAMSAAIVRLLTDEPRRAELVARGRERPRSYTWEACAEATLESWARAARARH